ncbi:terminase large subunit domain-containing protein [Streptomyces luteolus]|uniref:Terminase family protein n=1 Tax=Streptomyces luteolus TaxID=3043615 RepID=A0ABT6SYM9_9ACTN|nr:terminase family protein [Streptomyces sp. B-S-A12]MDI3420722.1 terminase family protein [Streptomyces sp. B-S-A12]
MRSDRAQALERAQFLARLTDPVTLAHSLQPSFEPRPHNRVIARGMRRLINGKTRKLLITTPPQVGKSTTAAVWGVFWWLARHPRDHVIIVSYGAELAEERGRAIRKLIRAHGAEFGLALDAERASVADWRLTTGGGVRCAGIGGSLTGHPASVIIIDDPHKNRQETDSPTMRKRVADSYSADLYSRLAPVGPLLLVLTRWHEDDLAGRLLRDEPGEWDVIHMPAIADLTLTPDGGPLGRQDGDPLSHPKIPTRDKQSLLDHWLAKKRGSSPFDWGALYQGNPQPVEGALVTAELMRTQTHLTDVPAARRIGVAVDPSGGGRDTAGIIGGLIGTDRRLYWTHDRTARMSSDAWSRAACTLAAETDASVIVIEKNFGGDQAELAVKGAWDKLRREHDEQHEYVDDAPRNPYVKIPPLIEMRSARQNKIVRAEPVAGQLREDRIRLAGHLPDLVKEWVTFQPDSSWSPGRIDASVLLAYELLGPPISVKSVSTPKGSRTDIARRNGPGTRRMGPRSYGGGRD